MGKSRFTEEQIIAVLQEGGRRSPRASILDSPGANSRDANPASYNFGGAVGACSDTQ